MKINSQNLIQYVICMGAFISTISAGMFNIALVDIAKEYNQPIQTAQWMITVYLLATSICLPLMGRMGDNKGKRTIFNLGIFIYMIGSVCCALSPNLASLIAFRAISGIGTAMFQATNMALIVSLFPPERRGTALGLTTTFVAAGSMIGPSLGGIMLQWFSWHMNFWLLAVISLVTWIFAQRLIPKDQPKGNVRLDWTGAFLFSTALTGLITGLNMGSLWGWESIPVILLFVIFAVCGASLIFWSISKRWGKTDQAPPFIQFGMFANPRICLGITTSIITSMSAFSAQLVLPVYLRSVLHIEPALTGLILLAHPAMLIFVAPISGRLSDRIGSLPIIYTGLSFMVTALIGLSFISHNSSVLYVFIFSLIFGCSMGMVNTPNNNLTLSIVPKNFLGLIGSMMALSRNMGMILGSVAGGVLMSFSSDILSIANFFQKDLVVSGFRAVFSLTAMLVATIFIVLLVTAHLYKRNAMLQNS